MPRIMIIDDDVDVAKDISEILQAHGYETSLFDALEGALEAIEEVRPDLLILDVMFPSNPAGGFDLARTIRQTRAIKRLPIILLTSINAEFPMDFSSQDIDPKWMPVQAFLEKPVRAELLLQKIGDLL